MAYRDGAEVGRTALVTAGAPRLVVRADRTRLRANDGDLAYLAVELRDAAGTLVTTADRAVTVELSGSGTLAGMCSANPRTAERFDSATWRTFDGRALAFVRPTRSGAVTVRVTAPDLDPVTLALEVL